MALFVLWCFVLVAAALPDVCPQHWALCAYGPDLWLVLVAYLALRGRGYRPVGWAIVLGLVRDSLSLDPLGTHAFVLGLVAFLFCEGRRARGRIVGGMGLLATFAAALLGGWAYVLRVLPWEGTAPWEGIWAAVPTAVATTLLAWVVHGLLDRTHWLDEIGGRTRGLPA